MSIRWGISKNFSTDGSLSLEDFVHLVEHDQQQSFFRSENGGATHEAFVLTASEYVFSELWRNPLMMRAVLTNHSDQWNKDALDIAWLDCLRSVRTDLENALTYVWFPRVITGAVYGENGAASKAIAGANWLSGEAGKKSLADAVAAGVGTEEEVRSILINRLIAMENPVPMDHYMDKVPPTITVSQTPQAQYYATLPEFVPPSQQEMPTSVFLRYSVMDESSVTLEIHVGLSYVSVESLSGERWIRDGTSVSFRATDAAGNQSVRTFTNAAGVITETSDVLEEVE